MKTDLVSVEKTDRIAMVRFDRGDHANSLSFAVMRWINILMKPISWQQIWAERVLYLPEKMMPTSCTIQQ